jgi:prepilin-type N-terminal cleavage/methylation domain-containing protein
MQNRKGFTLIELLIVVVIIGILAAIAIPKFANTKEKAVLAGMKSDLRNLVTAQEAYFSDNQTYAPAIGAAQAAGVVAFVPSANNVIALAAVTAAGWNATATNATLKGTITKCGIFVGSAAAPAGMPAGAAEGAPACF